MLGGSRSSRLPPASLLATSAGCLPVAGRYRLADRIADVVEDVIPWETLAGVMPAVQTIPEVKLGLFHPYS
jgi:hypothetical protein